MLAAARRDAQAMVEPLADHPELYHAGYTQDALKEPGGGPSALRLYHRRAAGNAGRTEGYGGGLPEGADRSRHRDGAGFALDLMRQDRVEEADPYLEMMDEIYSLLLTVDFPDAVTGGLRRQTDVLRGVLERTRGDLTTAARQEKMQAALRRVEERLG